MTNRCTKCGKPGDENWNPALYRQCDVCDPNSETEINPDAATRALLSRITALVARCERAEARATEAEQKYRDEHEKKMRIWDASTRDIWAAVGVRSRAIRRAWRYRRERDAAVARANTLAEAAKAALFGIGHGQWCACDICNPLRNAVAALGEARDD